MFKLPFLSQQENLQVFTSTFLTVLVAEIGDKTQLSTFALAAKSDAPLVVFLGAGLALLSTSFLGVVAGRWLSDHFTTQLLDTLTGVSFLVLAIGLLWEAIL